MCMESVERAGPRCQTSFVSMARNSGGSWNSHAQERGRPAESAVLAQFAGPEIASGLDDPEAADIAVFDRGQIRDSFTCLMTGHEQAMVRLFSLLFAEHRELRALFPLTMTQTRASVFESVTRLIWMLDDRERTERMLGQIARDHRKYGVAAKHYGRFFDALIACVQEACGSDWTVSTESAWRSLARYFITVMSDAVAQDARNQPAWWVGEVVQHELRAPTIAALTIRPDKPLVHTPGQYVWIQTPRWPRIWRRYSIANVPRENGLLDFHVRAVPGGLVSTALTRHCVAGDTVLLSAARGAVALPADPGRSIVCVAGGTGMAQAKAIIEAVTSAVRPGRRRALTLYYGARTPADLYDMNDLEKLRMAYPPFTVVPVVETGPATAGRPGRLIQAVREHASYRNTDVYISGPAGMVGAVLHALTGRIAPERLHHDPLELLQAASGRLPVLLLPACIHTLRQRGIQAPSSTE